MSELSVEIQERFIAAVVKDSTGERLEDNRRLPRDAFTDHKCREAWRALIDADSYERGALDPRLQKFWGIETRELGYTSDRDEVYFGLFRQMGLGQLEAFRAIAPLSANKAKLRDRLAEREFRLTDPPPEPEARFRVGDKSVCTPGNLTNLIAQAKAGKSAVVGAMIAAAICADQGRSDRDTLGFVAAAPRKRRLLHFDTEQSPYDHHASVLRTLRRADVKDAPDWLRSFALAGCSSDELRHLLRLSLEEEHTRRGVFGVIIDGTADLVADVNDPRECNSFVAELHDMAIEYGCPVINVVHENPGQIGGKMRGHLGSQLERKAESNLRLRKDDETTTIFSEKMRRAPILEKDGPRFVWSNAEGMHVSIGPLGDAREASKRAEIREIMAEALGGGSPANYGTLREAVMRVRDCARSTAERYISTALRLKVIRKRFGGAHELAPSTLN